MKTLNLLNKIYNIVFNGYSVEQYNTYINILDVLDNMKEINITSLEGLPKEFNLGEIKITSLVGYN